LARAKDLKRREELEAELHGAPLPPAAAYLWGTFLRLHTRRGNNGFGVLPLSWSEIDAFCRLSGVRLAPWEVEIVEALDDAYMAEQVKDAKARAETKKGDKR